MLLVARACPVRLVDESVLVFYVPLWIGLTHGGSVDIFLGWWVWFWYRGIWCYSREYSGCRIGHYLQYICYLFLIFRFRYYCLFYTLLCFYFYFIFYVYIVPWFLPHWSGQCFWLFGDMPRKYHF